MTVRMTRYKQAEFNDEDTSSVGTIHLNETCVGMSSAGIQIRYHTSRGTSLLLLWRSRTRLEKNLFLIITMLLILLLMFIILLLTQTQQKTLTNLQFEEKMNQNYLDTQETSCLDENCVNAASDILKSIDRKIDPCDDFYAYSCNQWIKNNPVPDGKSIWGTFGKLEHQNQLIIKNVLEKQDNYFKSKAELKAKYYYQSCLDDNEIMEKLGSEPLKLFLMKIGGWNLTASNFQIKKWNLQNSLKILQNVYNMGGLFTWAVGEDDTNSTQHIIQIDQGGLTLPTRDNYLNKTEQHEKILNAYLEYVVKIGELLGSDRSNIEHQIKDIIKFEKKLAQITIPSDQRRNETAIYHKMKLSDLQDIANFINWTEHFRDAFKIIDHEINQNEVIVVYAPEYLRNLTKLIHSYEKTNNGKIVLNNYLVWQSVRTLTGCLSKQFRDAYKILRKALIGSDGGEENWRYCVQDTNNVIGFALGAMFVREVFHGESKPKAEKMINEIRQAFKANLRNLDWMDNKTIQLAEEKADAITDMIGFPNYILNDIDLDKKYEDLNITATEYFQNNLRVNLYNLKKNLEKLKQTVNKTHWGMTPSTVNAYYTPTKNQIVFPAGILQKPFYDLNMPKSLNFGAMGVVMGHELTHAFDDQGREYDKNGNLKSWWELNSIERFNAKTECFVNQYDAYTINSRNLNGKQTLGENIADNGGLKASYHAYIKSNIDKKSDYLLLPGLNLTHRQLFFISFAQVWCSTITDEAAELQIEKDPHSPPQYRVIGPLSNLKEFSEEFKCPLGSKMNPIKKCIVW